MNRWEGTGWLTADALVFPTTAGTPRVVLRLAVPRDRRSQRTVPPGPGARRTADFVTVEAFGAELLPLLDHLRKGVRVAVRGWLRSRDLKRQHKGRVVSAIVAWRLTIGGDDAHACAWQHPASAPRSPGPGGLAEHCV